MMTRSFGMGAYEAEKNGGDVNEMIYQGTKRALIEDISEKLFTGNPVYDQGGGMVTDLGYAALYKTLGEEGAERLLRSTAARVMALPSDMLGEGLEEIVSDVANPLVDRLANALDGGNRDATMPNWGELGMGFAVGAALGGTGHGVNALSASRQFGYMSQNNPYAVYMIDMLKTAAAENTAVPEDVLQNAKAIMPEATDEEIQEYYERYLRESNDQSNSDLASSQDFTEAQMGDTIYAAEKIAPPTSEELLSRAEAGRSDPNNQGVIADRILSGEYSLQYKHNKYVQHTKGTKLYDQVTEARGKPQSYFTITEAEASALVYQYAGTGTSIVLNNGKIAGFEYVTLPVIIGKYFDMGEWHYTTRAKIIYAKSGVHIVPVSNKYEKIT